MRSSPLRRKVAAVALGLTVPGLVLTATTGPAAFADPPETEPAPTSSVTQRLAGEVPSVVEITVPGTAELDRLVATGVDLDHGVEQRPDGLEVRAIVTPNEVEALEKAGFEPGGVLYTQEDTETALAERDATIAAAKAENEAFADEATHPDVSDIKITRAQYFTSFGVPVLSVEAKWANGQDATEALTVERDSGPGTAFGSGGTQTITRFVDAGVYLYHRGASPTTGEQALTSRPDRIKITSPTGDTAIATVQDWLPTGDEEDPFKGEGYQQDFVSSYLDPTQLYDRIKQLATDYPELAEIVELPNKTNGYRRLAQAVVPAGTAAADDPRRIGLDSKAYGSEGGNGITVTVVHPTAADQPLTVSVSGKAITVSSATDASGAATSTAAQVVAALNADPTAGALVSAYTYRGNAGDGVVPATATTTLTDGLDAPEGVSRDPQSVYAIKIGKVRDGSKPGVFFYAQEHAREWVPPLVTIETAERLLRNYASHAPTKDLVDNLEIWVLPSVNPDGGHYSFYDFNSQRKNMVNHCAPGSTVDVNARDSWGVDVNRNYDEYSLFDGYSGASTSCTSGTFAGPAELSEPEARNVDWVAARPNMTWSMNVHSSGNYFMWSPAAYKVPGRVTAPEPTLEEESLFQGASSRILTAIKRHRGLSVTPARTGRVVDTLYSAAGNSGDMLWYKYGIYAWDFEVGSTFQPPFEAETPTGPGAHQEAMEFANGLVEMLRIARDHDTDTVTPVSEVKVTSSTVEGKVNVEFATNEPASVFYTTDGTVPTMHSTRYAAAGLREGGERIKVDQGAEIRWITIDSRGNVERNFVPGREGNYRTWIAEVGYEEPLPASATSLTLDRGTIGAGETGVTASVQVTTPGAGDQPKPTGVVTVYVDGEASGSAEIDDDGRADIPLAAIASAGNHLVTATYGGSVELAASTSPPVALKVTAAPGVPTAAVSLSVRPTSITVGRSGAVASVGVTVAQDGTTTPGSGKVDVLVDGRKVGTGTLDKQGRTTVRLGPFATTGARVVTARYAGSGPVGGASSPPVVLRVTKAKPSLAVKVTPKRVTTTTRPKVAITVKARGVNARGTALVKVGKRSYVVKVNAKGKATVRIARLARGPKKVTVTYLGNDDLTRAKKVVTIRVRR
ncbi:M14 family zinc carboxypeptidase [Mumia quercus]|uniref:M14 family zinc carboxypeptidase n=1 Tax=Mumia quercus TaxID=2976125 RepID=UPI0021CE1ECD|nr:M14 family zinc carboxypeptidase [Mumia quercus]